MSPPNIKIKYSKSKINWHLKRNKTPRQIRQALAKNIDPRLVPSILVRS